MRALLTWLPLARSPHAVSGRGACRLPSPPSPPPPPQVAAAAIADRTAVAATAAAATAAPATSAAAIAIINAIASATHSTASAAITAAIAAASAVSSSVAHRLHRQCSPPLLSPPSPDPPDQPPPPQQPPFHHVGHSNAPSRAPPTDHRSRTDLAQISPTARPTPHFHAYRADSNMNMWLSFKSCRVQEFKSCGSRSRVQDWISESRKLPVMPVCFGFRQAPRPGAHSMVCRTASRRTGWKWARPASRAAEARGAHRPASQWHDTTRQDKT